MRAKRVVPGRPRSTGDAFDAELRLGTTDDRLCVRGVVDAVSAPLLSDDLTEALKTTRDRRLTVDLDDVAHLSAAGVAVLVTALGAPRPPELVLSPACAVRPVLDLCAVPYRLVERPASSPCRGATDGRGQHRAPRATAGAVRLAGLVRGLLP